MDATGRLSVLNATSLDAIVSPEELQDLVDRFGEEPSAWPMEVRAPAEELIDASVEARTIILQARRLRQQLRNMGPKAPSCIVDRIVSVALDADPPIDVILRLPN
jgi:hypothetical protein